MKQPRFFDIEERLTLLIGLGDQLQAFSRTVDFEPFRLDPDNAPDYTDRNLAPVAMAAFEE
ncbi:hypothetical protein WSS15_14320 [Acetobacter pasteurianus]|nr:hypothetical protein WSS15_14320 [Acetobacter pasteurianus]